MNVLRHLVARRGMVLAAAASLTVGAAYAGAVAWYGSWDGVRQRLSGQLVIVPAPVANVGRAKLKEPMPFHFQVRNCASRPVTLLGMRTDCLCVATGDFPIVLDVGATRILEGKIYATTTGARTRVLELYSDHPTASRLYVSVRIIGIEG